MTSTQEVAALLARIAERYRSISTYSDVGEQVSVSIHGDGAWNRRTTKRRFRTLFARPASFLFECKEVGVGPEKGWMTWVAWQPKEEGASWTWGTITPTIDGPQSLCESLSAIAGVCGGSSWPVGRLLGLYSDSVGFMPDPGTWRFAASEALEGRVCRIVEGPTPLPGHFDRFWFQEETLLLRRIENRVVFGSELHEFTLDIKTKQLAGMSVDDPHYHVMADSLELQKKHRLPDFVVESVTTWHPEVDVPIDPVAFEYDPAHS